MYLSNRLSTHFKKRETAMKWLCAAAAYCMLFSFIENPAVMTISLIGKEHLWLFFFFSVLYPISIIANICYMYKSFSMSNRFLFRLLLISNCLFPFTLTTLMPAAEANGVISTFATIVHWISGFGNIVVNATVTLLFLLKLSKRENNKKGVAIAWTLASVCILDALVFLGLTVIMKDPQKSKNGFFEIIPLAISFLAIYIVNHTDLISPRSQRDSKESDLKTADNSALTAVSFALFCCSFFTFTFYCFVRNPIHYTISMTGIDYPGGFALTCILLAAAFVLNFAMMFKKHNYKNYFTKAIAYMGSVSIIACVIFPTTMEKDINPIHSIGALLFFYLLLAAFIFLLFRLRKENKKYTGFLIGMIAVTAASVLAVVVMFVVLDQEAGRTGLTEVIPLEYMFAFTFLENFTTYFKEPLNNSAMCASAANFPPFCTKIS